MRRALICLVLSVTGVASDARAHALPHGAGHILAHGGSWDLFVFDGRSPLWSAGLEDPGPAPSQLRDALAHWKETCQPRTSGGELVRLTCGDVQIRLVELRHFEVERDVPKDLDQMALSMEGDEPLTHPEFSDVHTALVIGRDLDLRKWLTDVQFASGLLPGATVCPVTSPDSGVPTFDTKQLPRR